MQRVVAAVLLSGLVALPVCGAERDWQEEVNYLLDYVARSGCSFIRNGKMYEAHQARDHLNKKYEHIKNRISTTEQFITHAASNSSITGKAYEVDCGEGAMLSSTWLEEALQGYRRNR